MAQVFVSPGVYTQEIDDTFRAPGAGAIGAAVIGLTDKGEAFRPINVNNFSQFQEKFGGLSPTKYTPYAAQNYLRNGSNLKVVRVLGRGTTNVGNVVVAAFNLADGAQTIGFSETAGAARIGAIFRQRVTNVSDDWQISGSYDNFSLVKANGTEDAVTNAGVSGNIIAQYAVSGLSLIKSSPNYVKKVMGTDPQQSYAGELLPDLYVDAVFDYDVSSLEGDISGYTSATADDTGTAGLSDDVEGGFSVSQTPWIISQNYLASTYKLFKIYSIGHGTNENSNLKISITKVDTSATAYPTFNLVVRDFGDSDKEAVVRASYDSLTLDPSSKNYIGKVIGTTSPSYDFSTNPPTITFDGEYPVSNNSYIRVEIGGGFPIDARPQGFEGIPKLSVSGIESASVLTTVDEIPYKSDHLFDSSVDAEVYMGVDFAQDGVADRLKKTVTSPKGYTDTDNGFLIFSNPNTDYGGSTATMTFTKVDMNAAGVSPNVDNTTNPIRFSVPMFGGWDGFDPRVDLRLAANESGTNSLSAEFIQAINIMSNPDQVDFNLLALPDVHSSSEGNIPQRAMDMAKSRGDAFVLVDLASGNSTTADGINTTVDQAVAEANTYDNSYGATYYPWVKIPDGTTQGGLLNVPPSVVMMGVYAFSDKVGDPWFAPAGFNRGSAFPSGTTPYRVLTQTQRDQLYQANVNPIASFANQGVVAFGQKTLQSKASVLDRVNVRRMLIEVRKTISGLSRLFLFEPNTVTVRRNLLTQVNAYLSLVQSRQGLTEFRAVLDETTTTPDLIDRNIMKGKIFLKPTSAAEVILFDFTVTPQGATFEE